MVPFVNSKFGCQYRQGAIITARWRHTAAGSVWTKIGTRKETSYNGLTVVDRGTGLLTITFPKCREAVFIGQPYLEPLGDTVADLFKVYPRLLTPNTGTVQLVIANSAATEAVVDPPDLAILCVTMLLAR